MSIDEVLSLLPQAEQQFWQLLLLVGLSGTGKTATLRGAADAETRQRPQFRVRVRQLNSLSTLPILSHGQFTELQSRIGLLRECAMLTEHEFQTSPVFPSCGYRPVSEPAVRPPETVLAEADAAIDQLLEDWTRTLRESVDDPMMQANLDLLSADQCAEVE